MPLYKSATGKKVVIRLGKVKQEVVIPPEPTSLPFPNLDIMFPAHIVKIEENDPCDGTRQEKIDRHVRREVIRQNPQPFVEHFLHNSLPTGSWENQRCFIIGGGPSLKGFDFSRLRGEKIIAINKAFVDAPFAEVFFAIDKEFQDWTISGGEKMEEAQRFWPHFKGHKVWLKMPGNIYKNGSEFVNLAGHEGLSTSLEEGLYDGSNSGYAAINLAAALGANPIYLLGYDMKHDHKKSHYHEGYPRPQNENQLKHFAKKFPKLANLANEKGIQIINLNKDSELKCFEFGTIEEALLPYSRPQKNYVIVSFYTPEYTEDILRLTKSVEQFNLPYDFELIKNLPLEGDGKYKNWSKNAYQKAEFIKRMMGKYPDKDIIWIDADAVIQQYPALFDKMSDCDIGVRYREGKELLTGTLYIRSNKTMYKLIDEWIAENKTSKEFLEQKNLEIVLDKNKNIKIYNFPASYCQIFDDRKNTSSAVIEHFQSSRKWRKEGDRMKKISIIMPTCNQSKFIEESIESILSQTFENWELIIVDDGSTDDTWIKIAAYQFTHPDKIKIIQKKNGGTGSALNMGFEQATGEYETWLASDNKYYPDALQDMFEILEEKKEVDFVYCNCEIGIMDSTGQTEIQKRNYNEESSMKWDAHKFYENYNIGVIWLWRKELRISAGRYFITTPCEDYEMTIRMIEAGGVFYYHPIVSGWHRRHNENLTKKLLTSGNYIQTLTKEMVEKRDNVEQKNVLEKNLIKVYNEFKWGGEESHSGSGSDSSQTQELSAQLPIFLKRLNAKTIIDAPCGDWNWMKNTIKNIEFDSYIGIDIVDEMIKKNEEKYATEKIQFKKMNLVKDELEDEADVIICRDMFNHLTFKSIEQVLINFYNSGAKYVLMTNFPKHQNNKDLDSKNEGYYWRTIDFTKYPFNFPPPLTTINEKCPIVSYEDKELGLWKLSDLFIKQTIDKKIQEAIISHNRNINLSNSDVWCLEKIPKKAYFYWGAESLPFLRYLTIFSFVKYNPDWQVELFYPVSLSKQQTWTSEEHNYNITGFDYFPWLKNLPITLTPFDCTKINIPNSYPEVFKSDFLRWHLLSEHGGLWSDMDILYFNPMNTLSFNIEKNKGIDTIISTTENTEVPTSFFHSIGFLMSSNNNPYYTHICELAHKKTLNFSNYQDVGSEILNSEFVSTKDIQKKFPMVNVRNLPFGTLYTAYQRISEIFSSNNDTTIFAPYAIGIHWYAGHPLAEEFVNKINHTNYLDYADTPLGILIKSIMYGEKL